MERKLFPKGKLYEALSSSDKKQGALRAIREATREVHPDEIGLFLSEVNYFLAPNEAFDTKEKHQEVVEAMLDGGIIGALNEFCVSKTGLIGMQAAAALTALSSISIALAEEVFHQESLTVLGKVIGDEVQLLGVRHSACIAFDAIVSNASAAIRSVPGFISKHEGAIAALLSLLSVTGGDFISQLRSTRGEIQKNIFPGDPHEHAEMFAASVRETAAKTLASISIVIADIDKEKLSLITSEIFIPLCQSLISIIINGPKREAPVDGSRCFSSQFFSTFSHVPCQFDPLSESSVKRVHDKLYKSGVLKGLISSLDALTCNGFSVENIDHIKIISKREERNTAELFHIDSVLFVCDAIANMSSFDMIATSDTFSLAIPIMLALVRENDKLFGGDVEKIEQSDAHFKSFGSTNRHGMFHVTHFSPSAFHSSLITINNHTEYTLKNHNLDIAKRYNASKINKECGNELFKLGDFEGALWRYTIASRLHPSDDEQMGIFFSNRAECELQMNMFHDAFRDASLALKFAPNHEKSKSRKERALSMINGGSANPPPQRNHDIAPGAAGNLPPRALSPTHF